MSVLILGAMLSSGAERTPWEAYLSSPTPENAAKVADVTYGTQLASEAIYRDLLLLEVQVRAGDREAVRLALRLLAKSDGHYAETLCIMLGRIIRPNPVVFLREVSAAKVPLDRLGGLVGNFGPEYLDRMLAQRYEAQQRISALRTVSDARLHDLREACVKELKDSAAGNGG